jgi:hypothetical protein
MRAQHPIARLYRGAVHSRARAVLRYQRQRRSLGLTLRASETLPSIFFPHHSTLSFRMLFWRLDG